MTELPPAPTKLQPIRPFTGTVRLLPELTPEEMSVAINQVMLSGYTVVRRRISEDFKPFTCIIKCDVHSLENTTLWYLAKFD